MATVQSDQLTEGVRRYPIDDHGKIRFAYFSYTATADLSANDEIELTKLPPGRIRVLPSMSRLATSAFGAGRTLDIGHREYMKRPAGNDTEAEDVDAFADGIDVSSAVADTKFGDALKYDIYSLGGVTVFAKVLGGTMPDTGTVEGYIAYVYE